MMKRLLSLCVALAAVSPAPLALATTRVAVLTFAPLSGDLPTGAGEKAADLLASELKSVADLEVAPRAKRDEGTAKARLSEARAKLAQAREALSARRPALAQEAYEAALAAFRQSLSELDDFQTFIACEAELGALAYRRGDDALGRKAILEAMRLAGGRPLAVVVKARSFAPVAQLLAKEVAALPHASVRVDSTPEGAEVFIDGQDAGKAPVLLRDLPEGAQYVRAVLPSGESWGAVAQAQGGAPAGHLRAQSGAEGPAAELNAELAENRIEPQALEAARRAAKTAGAALVVFGALHRTPDGLALDAFLFNDAKDRLGRLSRVSFDTEMLDAGLQMDKLVSEIQSRLATPGAELRLPSRVADDRVSEGTLASEYRFGGATAESSETPGRPTERRVIVHSSPR